MNKYPLVRTVYLYLFSLVGLTLVIIGGVRFIDMGLKAFIFTQADRQESLSYKQPPIPYPLEKIQGLAESQQSTVSLTEAEKTSLAQWLADYKNWKDQQEKIDPLTAQRQRDASINLAMILVGLPLYLFHWLTIRRDAKAKNQEPEGV